MLFVAHREQPGRAGAERYARRSRKWRRSRRLFDVQTMDSRMASATGQARLSATLLALFAGACARACLMGIYGVMSFAWRSVRARSDSCGDGRRQRQPSCAIHARGLRMCGQEWRSGWPARSRYAVMRACCSAWRRTTSERSLQS